MENRGNRTGEELASAKSEFRSFRSSARANRNAATVNVEPVVSIDLEKESFHPGDFLICEYFVKRLPVHDIQAIETSVIWLTEGKGEEDIGVHFFERRQKRSLTSETFNLPQRASTVLPASPLSYEGSIIKIRWCVRVRLFLGSGEQVTEDKFFRLGSVAAFDQSKSAADPDEQSGNQEAVA